MADPYLSEIKYLGGPSLDFVEVAVTTGTDVSNVQVVIYNPDGTIRTTNALGAVVNTVAGKDVYVIDTATSATFNGLHKLGAVALVSNGTVLSFVSFDDGSPVTATEGPANGLTSTQIGQAGSGESLETTDGGATYVTQTSPNSGTVPCFVTGTLILTATGERPVETLEAGDLVVTRDNGLQPLRWVGQKEIAAVANMQIDFRPICIPAHSFGAGKPAQDLYVSPRHRIMVANYNCILLFGTPEVLTAAKHLTSSSAFLSDRTSGFDYFHLLFDQHQIVYSNGLPTESFHPGDIGLEAFDLPVREELFAIYPDLRIAPNAYDNIARLEIRKFEAELLFQAN
jgi:hypothetical protein